MGIPFLKTWLLGITAAALAVALAQALTPAGTVKKIGKLIGGLVLLLAAVRPLAELDRDALTAARAASGQAQTETAQAGEEVLKTLIEQKTAAYIANKGAELGCQITAAVTVQDEEHGWPMPWSVEVTGCWTAEQQSALCDAICADLNIPKERQTFLISP